MESVLFLLGHRAGGSVQHVREWSPQVWVLTGQLELQAEQFLLGSLMETMRGLGRGGGRAPPFSGRGKKGRREESSEKQGTPRAHTVLGRWQEGVPGRGLHGQTREREPGEAPADAVREGAGRIKVCARLTGRAAWKRWREVARSGESAPERVTSPLASPQLLPFPARGAERPRQSRGQRVWGRRSGQARGEARAASRKAVRGSSREMRVAEPGCQTAWETGVRRRRGSPWGVWGRRAEPARFPSASERFGVWCGCGGKVCE